MIAIIGILAAVVLGSLNDARDNANDASAQTSVNNIRNVAEVFYSENGFTYGTADDDIAADGSGLAAATPATSVCDSADVQNLLTAANAQTRAAGECVADDNAYGVEITLRNTQVYCVDSTGFAGQIAASGLDAAGDDAACN